MSIESLCTIHTVSLFTRKTETGIAFGQKNEFVPAGSVECRVEPLSAAAINRLGLKDVEVTHRIRFASNPNIDEKTIIKYAGTYLRPIGVPTDAHGLGRLWTVYCKSAMKDLIGTEIAQA